MKMEGDGRAVFINMTCAERDVNGPKEGESICQNSQDTATWSMCVGAQKLVFSNGYRCHLQSTHCLPPLYPCPLWLSVMLPNKAHAQAPEGPMPSYLPSPPSPFVASAAERPRIKLGHKLITTQNRCRPASRNSLSAQQHPKHQDALILLSYNAVYVKLRFSLHHGPYQLLLSSFLVPQPLTQPALAAFSAAIFASIFLLASRIISSLLRCSKLCLSSLFVLHAFFPGTAPDPDPALSPSLLPPVAAAATLSCSLYLVIRSG